MGFGQEKVGIASKLLAMADHPRVVSTLESEGSEGVEGDFRDQNISPGLSQASHHLQWVSIDLLEERLHLPPVALTHFLARLKT